MAPDPATPSWEVVGADAVVTSMYGAPLPEASEQLAAGTAEHSAAAVSERVQIFDDGFDAYVTVIALDRESMAQVMDRAKGRAGVEFGLLAGDSAEVGTVPVLAAVLGVASGIAMTSSLVTPLGLEALAGGARVGLVVPWWLWVLPVLCAVVAAASSVRGASVGPYRLGGVLREG